MGLQQVRCAAVTAAALIALAGITACGGGSSPSAAPSAPPPPVNTQLSLLAACKLLRADVVSNGGTPDLPTLAKIVNKSADGTLLSDADDAEPDIRKDDTIGIGFDMAKMSHDCRSTGVQIPVPGL